MSDYKRDHPRIKKILPAELIVSGHKRLFASTFDVSRTGIQVICDAITTEEIFGTPQGDGPSRHPHVKVKLRLPHPDADPSRIEADCRAMFSRRVSEQEFRVGLQIDAISAEHRAMLERFVDGCLNPA